MAERPRESEKEQELEPTEIFTRAGKIEKPATAGQSNREVDEEIQKIVRESGMKKPAKITGETEAVEGLSEEDVGELMDELEKTLKDF